MLDKQTEKQLILKAQNGDGDAFGEIVKHSQETVYAYILKNYCDFNEHLAEEVTQEAFIKAWNNITKFRGDCKFTTWVCKIARNKCWDNRRLNRNKVFNQSLSITYSKEEEGDSTINILDLTGNVEEVNPSDNLLESEKIKIYKKVLAKTLQYLGPKDAEILRLRDLNDLTYAQIANQLSVPIGTVMSRLYYARRRASEKISKKINLDFLNDLK